MSGGSLADAERVDEAGRPDPATGAAPGFEALLEELMAVRGATVAAVADGEEWCWRRGPSTRRPWRARRTW